MELSLSLDSIQAATIATILLRTRIGVNSHWSCIRFCDKWLGDFFKLELFRRERDGIVSPNEYLAVDIHPLPVGISRHHFGPTNGAKSTLYKENSRKDRCECQRARIDSTLRPCPVSTSVKAAWYGIEPETQMA